MPQFTMQLPMFQDDKQPLLPLPLQVAKDYKFPLQYHTRLDDTIVYSIFDWVAGLTGEQDPTKVSQVVRQFKKQTRISDTYLKMPYIGSDGKTYQRDFSIDFGLYQFAAYVRATALRPQIATIKDTLATAGVLADMIRQNPEQAEQAIGEKRRNDAFLSGKSEAWITARELGIQARNQCTAAIVKANPQMNIGETTNTTYKNVLGQDAAGLRQTLHIGQRQNPRDSMSLVALSYIQVAEAGIAFQLEGFSDDDVVPIETVRSVIAIVTKTAGVQAQDMARVIGIDLVTGQKLLK